MKGKKALLNILNIVLLFAGVTCAGILSLTKTPQGSWFTSAVGPLSVAVLIMLFSIVAIEIISVFKVPSSTMHTVYIAVALFFYYLTSFDAMRFFDDYDSTLPKAAVEFVNYLCLILSAVSVLYFLNYNYKLKISVKAAVFVATCSLLSFIAYICLYFVSLQYIPYLVFFGLVCILTARIYYHVIKQGENDLVFHITVSLVYAVCGMGLVDVLGKSGIFPVGTMGYQLIYTCVIILLFAIIYISHIIKTEKDARLASEYKLLL